MARGRGRSGAVMQLQWQPQPTRENSGARTPFRVIQSWASMAKPFHLSINQSLTMDHPRERHDLG